MKKYEYQAINAHNYNQPRGEDIGTLNRYGREGWELISVVLYSDYTSYYLKREIDTPLLNALARDEANKIKPRPELDDIPTSTQIRAANAARIVLYWLPIGRAENLYPEFRSLRKVEFTFPRDWSYHNAVGHVETNFPGKYIFYPDTGNSVDARP